MQVAHMQLSVQAYISQYTLPIHLHLNIQVCGTRHALKARWNLNGAVTIKSVISACAHL